MVIHHYYLSIKKINNNIPLIKITQKVVFVPYS
jgi:hypothetical protein